MAATTSQMLALGTAAPDFDLPDPAGRRHRLADFSAADALVVAFLCNHCPFVKHLRDAIAQFGRDYAERNVAMVAINSNDAQAYPADSPECMAAESNAAGYVFPYLFDESQAVAKRFRAACTPEFYLFDRQRRLAYRGQFDAARPGNGVAVTGSDLRRATDALLDGRRPAPDQTPSMGCNIKWAPGNAPDYFG